MGIVRAVGEAIRVEIQTAFGDWVDISDCVGGIEVESLGEPADGVGWAAEDLEIEVVLEDLQEYVQVASGKWCAAKPRTEV